MDGHMIVYRRSRRVVGQGMEICKRVLRGTVEYG
jgi:hypothetical protein